MKMGNSYVDQWCEKSSKFGEVYMDAYEYQGVKVKNLTVNDECRLKECIAGTAYSRTLSAVLSDLLNTFMSREQEIRRKHVAIAGTATLYYVGTIAYYLIVFHRLHQQKIPVSLIQISMLIWDVLTAGTAVAYVAVHKLISPTTDLNCFSYASAFFAPAVSFIPVTAVETGSLTMLILCCLDRIQALVRPLDYKLTSKLRRAVLINTLSLVVGAVAAYFSDAIDRVGLVRQSSLTGEPWYRHSVPQSMPDAICFRRYQFTDYCCQRSFEQAENSQTVNYFWLAERPRQSKLCLQIYSIMDYRVYMGLMQALCILLFCLTCLLIWLCRQHYSSSNGQNGGSINGRAGSTKAVVIGLAIESIVTSVKGPVQYLCVWGYMSCVIRDGLFIAQLILTSFMLIIMSKAFRQQHLSHFPCLPSGQLTRFTVAAGIMYLPGVGVTFILGYLL